MAKMTKAQKKVGKVMGEFKDGTLHSGKNGPVVKSRQQAIAIALSEAGRRKYAAGGPVDAAAPPVGLTDLSGKSAAPGQQQAQQQTPYYTPGSYGMEQGQQNQGIGQNSPTQVPGMTVRNRMTGITGVAPVVSGYAKGGLVEKPRGHGKAVKGVRKARIY